MDEGLCFRREEAMDAKFRREVPNFVIGGTVGIYDFRPHKEPQEEPYPKEIHYYFHIER